MTEECVMLNGVFGVKHPFDAAQDKPFDAAQDKPFDAAQDRLFGGPCYETGSSYL